MWCNYLNALSLLRKENKELGWILGTYFPYRPASWTKDILDYRPMRSSTSKSTFIGKNQVLQQKTTPSDIGHDDLKSIMSIIRAKNVMSLFLEELVAHGEEGDGEAGAEEDDEVEGQLVPGGKIEVLLLLLPEEVRHSWFSIMPNKLPRVLAPLLMQM